MITTITTAVGIPPDVVGVVGYTVAATGVADTGVTPLGLHV